MFKTLKPVLEKMLGGDLDDKKVVLIPNGGLGSDRAHMSYVYLEQFTTINNMYLKQLDLDRWPVSILEKTLEDCDVIVMSGGLVSRLLKAVDESGVREKLLQLIRSGKPVIGFSAGAMCLSKTTYFAEKYIGETDPSVVNYVPLGFVDFEVYPHVEEKTLIPAIKALLPPTVKGFALSPADALIVTQGEVLQAGSPVAL